ncbi:MAG: nucleoside monophosphate kinase [Patescibacteria group bacterium]
MQKQAIILIGPPGAGKGTQAELLADDFGFFHFDTSHIIEERFRTAAADDAVIIEARARYDAGKLVDPALVASWVIDKIRALGIGGTSIVFSGSFRTNTEAAAELPVLQEVYSSQNVHIVNVEVGEEESVKRNSGRRVCKVNRHPIPNFPEFANITTCPKDGSEIVTRSLDVPETIRVRYATYQEETQPVVAYFEQQGYTVIRIDGEQPIRKVHDDIMERIHALAHPQQI